MKNISDLVKHIIDNLDTLDKEDIIELKRKYAKQNKLKDTPSNTQVIQTFFYLMKKTGLNRKDYSNLKIQEKINNNEQDRSSVQTSFFKLLQKRGIRSQSGIVSIQTLTKPFPCPGQCIFCPNDPAMPKSYIKTEPGAMRAYLNNFDPIKQVYNRLLSLTLNGHKTDKIEMIILGGTWDVYPKKYKIEFVKGLYDACNTFEQFFQKIHFQGSPKDKSKTYTSFNENKQAQKDLGISDEERKKYLIEVENIDEIEYTQNIEESIRINETAPNRIIGLTVETRPEYITDENCKFWRELGVTRLEIGLQSTDDEVLEANKRGHTVEQMRKGLHKLRQYGFKFSVHMMPGLYKSSVKKDIQSLQDLYSDPFLKPDELKLYPTSVIPNTELFDLYKQGQFQPITTNDIKNIVRKFFFDIVPPRTRIKRLIRDIPATEIESGSNITNLNQIIRNEIQKEITDGTLDIKNLYERMYQDTEIIDGQVDKKSQRNFISIDTRSREIRNKNPIPNPSPKQGRGQTDSRNQNLVTVIRPYDSSVGKEYFISIEDELGYLYGFVRLLLPNKENAIKRQGLGKNTALIRELHVYGKVENIKTEKCQKKSNFLGNITRKIKKIFSKNTNTEQMSSLNKGRFGGIGKSSIQHIGIGKQLMNQAEKTSKEGFFDKVSVISGIGVRGYYKKLGYELEGTYMVKRI